MQIQQMWFRQVILLVVLICFAGEDLRSRKLGRFELIRFLIVAALLSLCGGEFWMDGIAGFFVGGVLLLISKLTRGQIGSGDAFLIMSAGLLLGFWGSMELLLLALVLAAACAGYLLVIRKKGRRYTIAFVPFLALSQLVILGLQIAQTAKLW